MKLTIKAIPFLALILHSQAVAQTSSSKTEVTQSSTHSSPGSGRNSTSVTTTSDGKTTVKKTVTVIDGVKKVVIESTDENGKTTRTESGGNPGEETASPWMGLRVERVSQILRDQLDLADDEGLAVKAVAEGSPAMASGILAGDLLLKLGENGVSSPDEVSQSLAKFQVGDEIKVTVMRKAQRMNLSVKLVAAPNRESREVPEALRREIEESSVERVNLEVSGQGLEPLLNDPDLPENFKETIREMQKTLQDFENRKK